RQGYTEMVSTKPINESNFMLKDKPQFLNIASIKKPQVYNFQNRDDDAAINFNEREKSQILAPILIHDEIIGFLEIESVGQNHYDDKHASQLLAFANQAGIAIENARLFQISQRRAQEAETLHAAGAIVIAAGLDNHEVFDRILESLNKIIPYDSASIQLLREGYLEIVGIHGWIDRQSVVGIQFPVPGNNPNTLVVEKRQPVVIYNVSQYPGFNEKIFDNIRSWLGVPVLVRDQVIGLITIDSRRYNFFTNDHIKIASSFANQVAIAVQNVHLYQQANYERQFFEALVENIPIAIAVVDNENRVLTWNPGAEQTFGYTKEEALGVDNNLLVANQNDIYSEAVEITRDSFKKDFIHTFTQRTRKNGSLFDVELFVVPVSLAGRRAATLVIYHDITELQNARKAAEAASRTKSAFVANMSHEIRTPLNAIIGFAELLERDKRLFPDQAESIRIIHRSSEALLSLINNILDLSKIEAGRMNLNETYFNLYEFLRLLEDMFRLKTLQKHINFIFEYKAQLPTEICTDEDKLRQILMNLIGNAIKFTHHGKITVRVQNGNGKVKNESPDLTMLQFSVLDTGVGIAPDELSLLFKPFSQTSSGKNLRQGTGLGLAISQQFVELMGGKIWASSTLSKGTSFEFIIPVKTTNQSAASNEAEIQGIRNKQAVKITLEVWKTVHPEWINQLSQSITEGDLDQVKQLAQQVSDQSPHLAATIIDLATRFDLHGLINLLPSEKRKK
ncbi:MAG: ATP-binding protein, partial [Anaerolineae bacterium]|nr:ATP-binding protein [Anaerolineae bacterium]